MYFDNSNLNILENGCSDTEQHLIDDIRELKKALLEIKDDIKSALHDKNNKVTLLEKEILKTINKALGAKSTKCRQRPIVVEATRWFENGDHPLDGCLPISEDDSSLCEGNVVRYFRRPDINELDVCSLCLKTMYNHGWIDTFEGGLTVCPGDWIVTGIDGVHYPCKPDVFERTFSIDEQ